MSKAWTGERHGGKLEKGAECQEREGWRQKDGQKEGQSGKLRETQTGTVR